LLSDRNLFSSQLLFWIGAGANMLLTIFKTSEWFFNKWSTGNINASWIIVPASNLIAVIFLPSLSDAYIEPAKFWFAVGIALSALILPVCLYTAIIDHSSDNRQRPGVGLFVVIFPIILAAYYSLVGTWDLLASVFFYFSLFLTLVMGVGFLKKFFYAQKAEMSHWAFVFLVDAVALGSIVYDFNLNSTFSNVIKTLFVYLASYAAALVGLHTLRKLLDVELFVPQMKWGPMSFMKLTHEALREGIQKVTEMLEQIENAEDANILDLVSTEFTGLLNVLSIHAKHEESIIFPELERLFPGISKTVHSEHVEIEEVEAYIADYLKNLHKNRLEDKSSVLAFKTKAVEWLNTLKQHLRDEEVSVTQVVRKYTTSEHQKKIVTDCYDATSSEEIEVFIPWVLNHLRMSPMRTKFIKTFVWAMPYRAQQIGLIAYRGVSDVVWAEIAASVPEAIPRGAPGWRRAY
jgi:hemerythrin-like domain-containing protein